MYRRKLTISLKARRSQRKDGTYGHTRCNHKTGVLHRFQIRLLLSCDHVNPAWYRCNNYYSSERSIYDSGECARKKQRTTDTKIELKIILEEVIQGLG